MVSETRFDSIFDYSSAFKYQSVTLPTSFNRSKYKSAFSYHSINIDTDEDTGESKEENLLSLALRKAITFLFYVMVFVSFPLSAWICVKKVHALERIVLMRLGKLQAIREPGFAFVLPLIDTWTRVDLRPQTFTLSTSQLLTADGGIVEVQSEIQYQVCDIVGYVLKLKRQEESLKDLCQCCLTNIMSEKDQDDLEADRDCICSRLKHELNQSSLKWGLEIINVCLVSVKVLKAAEPVDAIGTIMTALKAATGHTTDQATAVFPFVSEATQTKKTVPDAAPEENVLDILKKVLFAAESKALTKDINGSFKFDVVGNATKTVYCCFENGHASISEGPSCNLEPDVSLVMTEDNVREFLDKKLSPLQAYMDGRVMVSGDWSLLRPLARVLEVPLTA